MELVDALRQLFGALGGGATMAVVVTGLFAVYMKRMDQRVAALQQQRHDGNGVAIRRIDAEQQALERLSNENAELRERVEILEDKVMFAESALIHVEAQIELVRADLNRGEPVATTLERLVKMEDRIRRGRDRATAVGD